MHLGSRPLAVAFLLAVAVSRPGVSGDVQSGNFGAEADQPISKSKTHERSKRNSYPFSGDIQSHDTKIIALKGRRKPRVLLLTPETRILKNGSTGKLDDLTAGEHVSGSARKNAEGNEEAVTINLKGAKPALK